MRKYKPSIDFDFDDGLAAVDELEYNCNPCYRVLRDSERDAPLGIINPDSMGMEFLFSQDESIGYYM